MTLLWLGAGAAVLVYVAGAMVFRWGYLHGFHDGFNHGRRSLRSDVVVRPRDP